MLDIKLLRENPKELEKKLKSKVLDIDIFKILSLDEKARRIQKETDDLKFFKNKSSKEIAILKREKKDALNLLDEMSKISLKIQALDQELKKLISEKDFLLSTLPNIPSPDVPLSLNVEDNKCIKTFGDKKKIDFPIKNHVQIGETLNLFDFKRAAKISKNRFSMYTGMGARLERALINYMLDIHHQNGFIQIIPPLLVKGDTMFGAAQLPKFKDQLFHIKDEDYDLYLIPTAEVPLNGIHSDEILDEKKLPIKYVAYTPCFRREAGAAGKNERGLIRTHQFNKVELYSITKPEDSEKNFNEMLLSAEEILQGLDLHYKNMLLCSGDMSFASSKTIDIEVFLPAQDRYYEVSSVSNCRDFQARRAKIRYRKKEDEKPSFVHTLNASGVATSRLMVAILENNQMEDGSVLIPTVLRKYLDDQKYITKK